MEKKTLKALHKYASDPQVKPGFRTIVLLNILGANLHLVEDFYSHPTWVELMVQPKVNPVPIWFELSPGERAALPLVSGAYPHGTAPGQRNHEVVN